MSMSRSSLNCGASALERLIAPAIAFRMRVSGTRRSPAPAGAGRAPAAASTSSIEMRGGLEATTVARSTASSCARLRAAGDATTRSGEDHPTEAGGAARSPEGSGSSAEVVMIATFVATGIIASGCARMRRRKPDVVAGTSMAALSVSTSKRTSPSATRSPSCLCHEINRPSSMVRPSFGMIT